MRQDMMISRSKSGGGGVAFVILLLLVAGGVACWFLFKPTTPAGLPVRAESAPGAAAEAVMSRPVSAPGVPIPMTPAGDVDWAKRKSQIKENAYAEFKEPKIGENIQIQLASGVVVKGRISDLTEKSIRLQIGSGHATYSRSQLSPRSKITIFRGVFAEYTALKTVAAEKKAAESAVPPESEVGQGPE